MTQKQVLERIRTAVNIATGDDGHTGEKVLDIFVMLCKMTEKEYKQQVKYYGWVKENGEKQTRKPGPLVLEY